MKKDDMIKEAMSKILEAPASENPYDVFLHLSKINKILNDLYNGGYKVGFDDAKDHFNIKDSKN